MKNHIVPIIVVPTIVVSILFATTVFAADNSGIINLESLKDLPLVVSITIIVIGGFILMIREFASRIKATLEANDAKWIEILRESDVKWAKILKENDERWAESFEKNEALHMSAHKEKLEWFITENKRRDEQIKAMMDEHIAASKNLVESQNRLSISIERSIANTKQ
jgi:hypothetical protein